MALLEYLCSGKNVIHLGFADHVHLIKEKIENGTWLHSRLTRVSKRCLGIDTNREAVDLARDLLGLDDIECFDIASEDCRTIIENHWDYMVMGEILEHVDDPYRLLRIIHDRYSSSLDKLVITVPNAFSLQNTLNAFLGIECINTDHRHSMTPFTLAKLVTIAGMKAEDFWFCTSRVDGPNSLAPRAHPGRILESVVCSLCQAKRHTIVMIVRP